MSDGPVERHVKQGNLDVAPNTDLSIDDRRIYTFAEAARCLRMSSRTLSRHINGGKIPATLFSFDGYRYRFTGAQLMGILGTALRISPAEPPAVPAQRPYRPRRRPS